MTELQYAETHIHRMSFPTRFLRKVALVGTSLAGNVFKREIGRFDHDALSQLEGYARDGFGSIIVSTHPSGGEIPRLIATVMENPVLGDREILLPEGLHQHKGYYDQIAPILGINLCPIPIPDTLDYLEAHTEKKVKYPKELFDPRGIRKITKEYYDKYIQEASRVLGESGVVIIFPQGGRRPLLESVTNSVSTLFDRLEKKAHVEKVALMFVGIAIDDIENYADENIRGTNPGRRYIFIQGSTYTKKAFVEVAQRQGQTVDEAVLANLRFISPLNYL